MSTAHTSGASEDGKPQGRYQAYHEEKARGGIGLTMIGGSTAVAPDTPGASMLHLDASTDEIIPFYRQLVDKVHAHGATVFAQLAHMGRRANWDNQHWLSPVAPSPVREAAHRSFPKEMEDWDIRRLVKAFGRAARRVKEGGLDGLELSATHGHIFDQFWSPRTNQRTDAYGGSLENRMRFTIEVLAAIREEVGDDFVLGIRLSGDELMDGGMELADCLRIATKLSGDGLVDFIGVLGGQAENLPAHADIFPNMAMPTAPYLYLASAIKANVGVPVFHAQRITDLATADRAIRAGHVDMVAMTRAHIADPHIMRKLMEGRADDIRPCIGANYCIDRLYSGGQAYCLHNAATGRENTMPHVIARAPQRKRAVVVGAGPAGLEAARVLASRGHEVTVFEKRPRVGGQLQTAARVAWRESLLNIPRWLEAQARKNGATIHLGTEVDAAGVLACDPDVVILATGGEPAYAPFDGSTFSEPLANAIDTGCLPGQRILVFDDNGAEGAVSSCEYFAKQGASVEYVTADPQVAPLLERTTRPVFMRRAYELGVKFRVDTRLERVFSDGGTLVAVLRNEYTRETEELRVDRVVVDYGVLSDGTLYKALRPHSTNLGEVDLDVLVAGQPQTLVSNAKGRFGLFRIGDAVSSRNVHAAVYDALRLCKDL